MLNVFRDLSNSRTRGLTVLSESLIRTFVLYPSRVLSDCHVLFCRSVLSEPTSYRPRLLLEGRPGSGQTSHLAPAVLHTLEKFPAYTLDVAVLFGSSVTAPEESCAQVTKVTDFS